MNFYGFWGRICVARDWGRNIDNPSILSIEGSVSTGKTFILPLSKITKNSSLYGFWGRICAAGEELWINPSILQRSVSTGKTFTLPLSYTLVFMAFGEEFVLLGKNYG